MSTYPAATTWLWIALISAASICAEVAAGLSPMEGNSKSELYMEMFHHAMADRFPALSIDMNQLLLEYTNICPYLSECDIGHISGITPATYKYEDVQIPTCKPCDCSHLCLYTRNCCPGSPYQYFEFQTVSKETSDRSQNMAYFIGHCPSWYNQDDHVINRCTGDDSVFFPVSSLTTFLPFKNKYCAMCHNENDVVSWKLEAFCYSNEEKSVNTSADVENSTECWHGFRKYTATEIPISAIGNDQIIRTCNVTGLWQEFDANVNWACETMENLYRGFKNVFCYICNPGISSLRSDELISSCNVTGEWKKYQPEVDRACQSQPATPRLFPFKNIHCMICNAFMPAGNFDTSISETIFPSNIKITLDFDSMRSWEFLNEMMEILHETGIRPTSSETSVRRDMTKTEVDVMHIYQSTCGKRTSCYTDEGLDVLSSDHNTQCFPGYNESCSCSSSCAESLTCCPPMLVEHDPYDCVNFQSFPNWKPNVTTSDASFGTILQDDLELDSNFVVIDKCLRGEYVDGYMDSSVKFNNTSSQSWPNFPVRVSRLLPMYKNISYLLCNTGKQKAYMDLELRCGNFIDTSLYIDIIGLLTDARDRCNIHFVSATGRKCQARHFDEYLSVYGRDQFTPTRNISEILQSRIESAYVTQGNSTYLKCNQTGQWHQEHDDIKLICEHESESLAHLYMYNINGNLYKNFACFICNPTVGLEDVDHVISECNVTGAWTLANLDVNKSEIEERCNTNAFESRWLPFKNYFCSECNLPAVRFLYHKQTPGQRIQHTPRFMFALSENDWLSYLRPTEILHIDYNNDGELGTLLCSPNHRLEDGLCLPSYQNTELTYVLAMELKWQKHIYFDETSCINDDNHPNHVIASLDVVIDNVAEQVTNKVIEYGFRIKGFYINGSLDSQCNNDSFTFNLTDLTSISFSMTFGFAGRNVTELELFLLTFLYDQYSINVTNNITTLDQCTIQLQTFQIPPYTHQDQSHTELKLPEKCDYSKVLPGIDFLLPDTSTSAIAVDRFLLCVQFEFSPDDYHFKNISESVVVKYHGIKFESGLFKRYDTAIRICVNDYIRKLNLPSEDDLQFLITYIVFSKIVMGISVIFLAITFVVYCMLPSLRTLPGKNIMTLTFCLMPAQALTAFGFEYESGSVICEVIGILIHYFWLATFCALNVCSYHLFKIFYKNCSQAPLNTDSKRPLGYVLYTFGMPLVVVATVIIYYKIQSSGNSSGYGRNYCFVSDINTLIIAFMVPLGLLPLLNIIFFGLAFHKIRTTAKVQSSRATDRKDFYIFLRIVAITGINWPLYVVDSSFGVSYFSFFVEIVNSLQGVSIFLSYVCTGNTLALLKEKFGFGKSNKESSGGMS